MRAPALICFERAERRTQDGLGAEWTVRALPEAEHRANMKDKEAKIIMARLDELAAESTHLMILTIAVAIASCFVVFLLFENARARAEAARLSSLKDEATVREERLFDCVQQYAARELRILAELREATFGKEEAERQCLELSSGVGAPLTNLFQMGYNGKKSKQSHVRSLSEIEGDELDRASEIFVAESPGPSLLASRRNSRAGSVVGSQRGEPAFGNNNAEDVVGLGPQPGPLPGTMPPSALSSFMDGYLAAKITSTSGSPAVAEPASPKKGATPKRKALAPSNQNAIIWGA